MKKLLQMKFMLLLCALIVGSGTMWAGDVLTLDCATPAPTGSTSTALSAASDVATFLNSAAGLSSAENKITCSDKTGDIYKGKGSGGGDIPQQCLKVGKASGGGSFTFTIPNNYDEIDEVKMTCYGWKTSSSISVNGGTAQTFTTAQTVTTKTFELSSSSRTIAIAVTSSAVCITEIVLKKSGGSTTFKVTYNGNDATSGEVPVDNNEYAANAEVTVLGNTGDLAKTGCAFDGWNTQANGGGTNYDADDTFTISANTTLYAKWTPYTITAQSNNESYGTVTLSGNEITGSPNSGYRYANPAYTVSPENSATVVQDGNTFTVTPTANTTITINFEAIPTHTATFSVNGTTTTTDFQEGAAITFPANPADIDGKSFVGWTETAINGTTDETPTFVTSATMGEADVTYYAVFADVEGTIVNASTSITAETNGVPDGYGSANTFTEYTLGGIKYKIQQMYKNGDKLQWRAAGNSSGTGTMYNTDSFQKINSIVLTYNSNDAGKNFTVKVGNEENPTSGVSITPTVNESVYTFDCSAGNYSYFVLTNGTNAGYLDQITINYATGSQTYSGYCTTVAADTRAEADLSYSEGEVEIELKNESYNAVSDNSNPLINPNNLTDLTWSSTDETVATVSEGIVTLKAVGTTTITASFAGNDAYKPGSASFTLQVVDNRQTATVTWKDADGNNITELNVEKGDFIQGITLSCNVEGFTFTEEHLKHLWGTNETHDNYDGLQPAGYIFTPNAVWTAALGITTITATFPGNETHKPASATLTVNVTGGYVPDYATLPFEFDGGLNDIESTSGLTQNGLGTDYSSKPKLRFDNTGDYLVLKIDEAPGKLTFDIVGNSFSGGTFKVQTSADGETFTDLAYYTDLGNNKISEEFDDLADNVRYIKWVYTSKSSGNVGLGNIKLAKPSTDPVIRLAETSVEVDAKQHDGTIALTYKNLQIDDMEDFSVQFFSDEQGTVTTSAPEWVEALVAEQDPSVGPGYVLSYVIDANDGAERTAYLRVYADDDVNSVASDVVTITQKAPQATYRKVTSTVGITSGKYLIVYEEGSKVFNGSLGTLDAANNCQEVVINDNEIKTNEAIYFTIDLNAGTLQSASGKYIGKTGSQNGLDVSEESTYTNTFSIDASENAVIKGSGGYTLRFNSASNQNRFRYYGNGQQDIQLYKEVTDEEKMVISIAAACTDGTKCYSTFSSSKPFIVPDGLTVSEISIQSDGTMKVESYDTDDVVPADRGVMVSAQDGGFYEVTVPVTEGGSSVLVDNNALRPTGDDGVSAADMEGNDSNCKFYRLTMHNGTDIGFWWGNENGTAFAVGSNKAYMAVPTSVAGARNGFAFGDEATGISQIENGKLKIENCYDLQGRKVSKPGKGLYIVNGKKVVIK